MDPHQPNPCTSCPDCGAPLQPGQTQCWLCQTFPAATLADKAGAGQSVEAPGRYQDRLASVLLVMTLIAVVASMIAIRLEVGIAVALVTLPALAWTCQVVRRRKTRGQSLSVGRKV